MRILRCLLIALFLVSPAWAQPESLNYTITYQAPTPTSISEGLAAPEGRLHYAAYGGARCRPNKPGKNRCVLIATGDVPNLVVNAGRTHLVDVMANGTAFAKFSGWGTGTTAAAAGDTGCTTEATTQYNPDNTRSTGTKSASSNVLTITGTQNFDQNLTVAEFCLMSNASVGSGTIWTHIILPSTIVNPASITWTYTLTLQ